jgi:ABC-type uncharacterized transport system involved in gliding motility auxiliary subunit
MQKAVNVLGWLGVVAVVVSVVLRFQSWRLEWQPYSWYAAVAGLVLILVYLAGQWREIGQSFRERNTRLGTIAATSVIIVLGILVALNYLSSRRNWRWDLTEAKQFSVSDQTRQILRSLDAPVQALVFDRPDRFDAFRDRLAGYEHASNGRLTVEYVNPDREPARANQNQVQSYGTVVFRYGDRTERVVSSDEQQLTNALIKVISGEQRTVYFLEGHGEREITSSANDGYATINQALGSENYQTQPLALAQQGRVPDDASVLVVARPTIDLLQPEVDAIRQYLDRGGKLFVLLEPPLRDARPMPDLMALLTEWGFEVGDDIIVDTNPVGQLLGTGELAPVATRYPSHPITSNFRVITAYPTARSVRPGTTGASGRSPQVLLESSAASWAETDIQAILNERPVELDPDTDLQGPVSIGAALSVPAPNPPAPADAETKEGADAAADDAPTPETRIVVIGDSDFAANNYLGIQGNRDIFLNAVNWLAQQENLISIRPRDPEDRRLTLTARQQNVITWSAIAVVPLLIFGAGIFAWTRRRG